MSKNLLYPGRPNYKGPTKGVFGLLHHDILVEWSHNVMERVEYVKRYKAENEVEIRLWNMCYLSEERLPKELMAAEKIFGEAEKTHEEAIKAYEEAWKTYDKAGKTYEEAGKTYVEAKTFVKAWKTREEAIKTFRETWKTHREAEKTYNKILKSSSPQILNLIKELVPDTVWNGKELVF